jgi:hypothetical protein
MSGSLLTPPLEEAVTSELVSKVRFPVTRENTANYVRLRGAAPEIYTAYSKVWKPIPYLIEQGIFCRRAGNGIWLSANFSA